MAPLLSSFAEVSRATNSRFDKNLFPLRTCNLNLTRKILKKASLKCAWNIIWETVCDNEGFESEAEYDKKIDQVKYHAW